MTVQVGKEWIGKVVNCTVRDSVKEYMIKNRKQVNMNTALAKEGVINTGRKRTVQNNQVYYYNGKKTYYGC